MLIGDIIDEGDTNTDICDNGSAAAAALRCDSGRGTAQEASGRKLNVAFCRYILPGATGSDFDMQPLMMVCSCGAEHGNVAGRRKNCTAKYLHRTSQTFTRSLV